MNEDARSAIMFGLTALRSSSVAEASGKQFYRPLLRGDLALPSIADYGCFLISLACTLPNASHHVTEPLRLFIRRHAAALVFKPHLPQHECEHKHLISYNYQGQ